MRIGYNPQIINITCLQFDLRFFLFCLCLFFQSIFYQHTQTVYSSPVRITPINFTLFSDNSLPYFSKKFLAGEIKFLFFLLSLGWHSMGLPLNYLRIIAASSKYLFRIFRLFNRRKNIVPLH